MHRMFPCTYCQGSNVRAPDSRAGCLSVAALLAHRYRVRVKGRDPTRPRGRRLIALLRSNAHCAHNSFDFN